MLGRGSGWPGGGTGRPPRDPSSPAKTFGIRATLDEIAAWTQRAQEENKPPSAWARDELNAAAAKPRAKTKP